VSVFSRLVAPKSESDVAGAVLALFSSPQRPAPIDALSLTPERVDRPALGMSATRISTVLAAAPHAVAVLERDVTPPDLGLDGLGTSAIRAFQPQPLRGPVPELFCPPAVRDDVALGEAVNDAVVEWAEEVGIYPGQLGKLREANFGRLIMLTHPGTDDPDRLLAATKCIVAEWATDDHFLDDESLGGDPATIGGRLGVAYASIDPADLPAKYAPQLDEALSKEPVSAAYRSAFEHLARYASASQLARLRHELAVMFVAYNQEANWRLTNQVPPVWEYLLHRHDNSFLPPMVLVDPVAGYEIPAQEFADRRVRRVFCIAGSASVVLNDLYSMSKESDTDFDLPKVIAAEEHCSPDEAIRRTVDIHNELMHTFVEEATVLSQLGSPALRRFLTDIWAWLGGNREWHSTTGRYNSLSDA
jgi:2-methylisoborneol synthase